jgi:hypothetical protein
VGKCIATSKQIEGTKRGVEPTSEPLDWLRSLFLQLSEEKPAGGAVQPGSFDLE